MSHLLFPRLHLPDAVSLFNELKGLSIEKISERADTDHPRMFYAQTGGTRVDKSHLETLRYKILELSRTAGYPEHVGMETRNFDLNCGAYFLDEAGISLAEGFHPALWSFLSLVLLPDIAFCRFPYSGSERFIGGIRNVFQRLWRRSLLLAGENGTDRWNILKAMSEDELFQLTERTGLTANPHVAKGIANVWYEVSRRSGLTGMADIHKMALKRIRALYPIINLDQLEAEDLRQIVRKQYEDAISEKTKGKHLSPAAESAAEVTV